ncbi:LADA_0C05446g1_1 [Lachancea dasiensis]|uniref:LADA_0C05446g1_1 n=1 Tax=Lachancea dasiensis TaxID=1072105 RepID=A0A1G4IZM8_9SACH|nr:LADA_0C05446g1_1 [Lachancea dasiensis]
MSLSNAYEEPVGTINNSLKRESVDIGIPNELLEPEEWENMPENSELQDAMKSLELSIERKMIINKKRRLQIFEESRDIKNSIKYLEFESYDEYFTLRKFKRGISASGKVGSDDGRFKSTGIYYEKISRSGPGDNKGDRDANYIDNDDDNLRKTSTGKRRTTRSQVSKVKQEFTDPVLLARSQTKSSPTFFDTTISVGSIIPSDNTDSNIRRSSRLSQRERDILERKAKRLEEKEPADASLNISDLFESIVPKVVEPVRRSDWLLPNKNRFLPEKFAPVKHTPEQIKINDLIHNSKIRKIMKRFKGGLAGVRKKDWDYGSVPNQPGKISA